jgi:hypothetical protein
MDYLQKYFTDEIESTPQNVINHVKKIKNEYKYKFKSKLSFFIYFY